MLEYIPYVEIIGIKQTIKSLGFLVNKNTLTCNQNISVNIHKATVVFNYFNFVGFYYKYKIYYFL